MKYVRLGATDLVVSEIGFGCARLGGFFQGGAKDGAVRALRAAHERGITFFDTSDMYSQGESEAILGHTFRDLGSGVTIATKVGYTLPSRRTLLARAKPLLRPLVRAARLRRSQLPSFARGTISQDFSPGHIVRSAEASLRRLRRNCLDLYQLHSPPAELLASGDFLEPLERLKSAGKIRYYGVSCETAADVELALRHPSVSTVQLRLSLLAQQALASAVPAAAAKDVGVIARECFAGGLLTKPLDALGLETFMPSAEERATKEAEIAGYHQIAAAMGRTMPECAFQFVRATLGTSVVLLGMRDERQVDRNLALLDLRPLARSEVLEIRAAYERNTAPNAG